MGSGIFFWLILICAAPGLLAFNCTECDKSKCPPKSISCPGRAATDPCGCCRQCAKQEWEPCGGENWELGYCDLRYRCAAVNGTGNVEIPDIGVCKYEGLTGDYWMDDDMNCPPVYGCKIRMSTCECTTIRTCVDYFTISDDNSCLKHRRGMDYGPYGESEEDVPSVYCSDHGCDLLGGRCVCDSGKCGVKFQYRDQKECNDALVRIKCANVHCPEQPTLNCSSNSVITKTYTPAGECCPTVPSFCTCNFKACAKCPYGKTQINVRNATGIPGDCCNDFYCVKQQETRSDWQT